MNLSEMKQVLAANDLRLTKSLGQNFLHDRNQLLRIVAAAELGSDDRVLEIGPGLGPLTELLLAATQNVAAIEKDRRLCEILRDRFGAQKQFTLIEADAFDYIRGESRDWSSWKLVSNLPYSVASPILFEFGQMELCPERIVATLQLEVAERLIAQAGSRAYGLLGLIMQLRYNPLGLFKIPRTCFFPPPAVDSACVTLLRRGSPLLEPHEVAHFVKIARRSFSQRRKMMINLLKQDWPAEKLSSAFDHACLSQQTRAEAVTLEQFVTLTRSLRLRTPS